MALAPLHLIYVIVFFVLLGLLFMLIEINLISYAFRALGLPRRLAFLALLASLLGSYINIPVAKVESRPMTDARAVEAFGMVYIVPLGYAGPSTTIAVNEGGAIVPVLVSAYALIRAPTAFIPAAIGTAIVALVVHREARPIRGVGIALPMFIPGVVAALTALVLAAFMGQRRHIDVIAYVAGVLGTLIGADIANLGIVARLGAPVASIGGAGTFDGIFLTGIVAVLLAGR